jgi:hypothetical protein
MMADGPSMGPGSWPSAEALAADPAFAGSYAALVNPDEVSAGEGSVLRPLVTTNASLASGVLRLAFFTARKTETVNSLRVFSASTAAGATPSLVRSGIYSVDGSSNITLQAAIVNDTSIFAAANTAYTRALSVPFAKVAGTRYAVGVLVVTAAAAPNTPCSLPAIPTSEASTIAPILSAQVGGQTDLPASVAVGSFVSTQARPYVVLVP